MSVTRFSGFLALDGMSLMQKISGAFGLFLVVVASKVGSARLLRAMSAWMIGPTAHLWVVKASSHLHTRMAMESLLAAVFILFLLSWDLYACPQTLASVSACLRSSALIRTLVFLSWRKLCFHSLAVEHLMMEAEKQKKKNLTAKLLRRRLLLWLLWGILTLVLSTLAIAYQVAKSIPGSLQAGKLMSLALQACIGATQGFVGNFIVPYLASKVTGQKHAFTAVSSLLMSCVLPAVVIIYLDTGCFGRWVSWWKSCRSNSQFLRRSLSCNPQNSQGCRYFDLGESASMNIDIRVLRPSDICNPHFSWSFASISSCVHISLLRLQEIWLTKFITTGLVMPGVALMRGKLPTESGAVVGTLGIYVAFGLVSSGHLPLMNFILYLAFLGEGLVARVAWVEKCLKNEDVQNVAALVAH